MRYCGLQEAQHHNPPTRQAVALKGLGTTGLQYLFSELCKLLCELLYAVDNGEEIVI